MDGANIPSFLSALFFGYLNTSGPMYQNTRTMILSNGNPYFIRGPWLTIPEACTMGQDTDGRWQAL